MQEEEEEEWVPARRVSVPLPQNVPRRSMKRGREEQEEEEEEDVAPAPSSMSPPLQSQAPRPSKVPMINSEMTTILHSYVDQTKMTLAIPQIYDKQWKVMSSDLAEKMETLGTQHVEEDDAMDIDSPPSLLKETIMNFQPKKRSGGAGSIKIIDNPQATVSEDGKLSIHSNVMTTGGAMASITSPTMLNERYHQFAEQTSKILNESGHKKLLAVDKSVLESNAEANAFMDLAMKEFMDLFRSMDINIFNPDYIPTSTNDGNLIVDIPECTRSYLSQFLRAAVVENHERGCSKHDNCIGHQLHLFYKLKTANNSMAGPQFPEGTHSFTLREFHLPEVMKNIITRVEQSKLKMANGEKGETMAEIMQSIPHGLCLLDTMYVTNNLAINAARKNQPITTPVTFQNFSIIINRPGEYNNSALLSLGPNNLSGLIAPYPELRLTNYFPYIYSIVTNDGKKKNVLGWAEVDDIIQSPSAALQPRGYEGHAPMPPVQTQNDPGFSGERVPRPWRSRHFQNELRKNAIYNVQVNRFTGDTHQTGGATTTKYKERKLKDDEKHNPPYFKKHEWLIGNNAFSASTIPTARAQQTLTGTGTCQLPTTIQSLCHFFTDPISEIVFTDHLRLHAHPENFTALRNHSEAAAYILDHKPYWTVTEKTIKPEWVGTPLLEWITFRLNWAYFKKETIRKLYDKQISNISTGIYVNNTWYTKRNGHQDETLHKVQTDQSLLETSLNSPYSTYFELLQNEMNHQNNVTIVNVTLRSTGLPVHTHLYDPYVSRDELSANMVSAAEPKGKASKDRKKFVPNRMVFTHHRYWALYYIHLLERFIESHDAICRAMAIEDDQIYIVRPIAPPPTRNVPSLVAQYKVPTFYHPFDEKAAQWNWTSVKGHQGSRAILAERYPNEIIFKYPLVYLYHIMLGKLPKHMISEEIQASIRQYLKLLGAQIKREWHQYPLFPRDLLQGNTTWDQVQKTEPFQEGSNFLWTVLCVTGRMEQLRRELEALHPVGLIEENEQDFYLHALQVRETGYLPIMRWMLSEILLPGNKGKDDDDGGDKSAETKEKIQTEILDSRVTEAIEYFNVDDMDFDGELDMPNLSNILHLLNYWYLANPLKKNPILEALQKAIPFKSMARVLSDHFFKQTKRNVNMITLSILFVMVTSLGLFRRQKGAPPMYRPCFSSMVKIDFAILQTPKQLFNFIHVTKSKILVYMSREVLIHAMAKAPHYRDNQIINWQMLEEHTWEAGNMIRRYLHHYKFWLKAPFNNARLNLEEEIQLKFEKKYNIFLFPKQDFLHTILHVFQSIHIKHLDKIILLQSNLKQLHRDATSTLEGPALDELKAKIERSQLELGAITYELSDVTRNVIWQTLIGKRKDIDIWSLIRQWLQDDDLLLFHRLHEEHLNHTPPKKLERIASQFTLSAFTMIHYLLQIQYQLKQFNLVPIPKTMAEDIHQALRNRRHHLFDTQPMLSTVYHVNVTLCCNQVITLHDTGSYGNSCYMYNRELQYYSCCRKRTKKTGFTGGASTSDSLGAGKQKKRKAKSKDSDGEDDDEDDENDEEDDEDEDEDSSDEGESSDDDEEGEGEHDDDELHHMDPAERKLWRKIQKRHKKVQEIASVASTRNLSTGSKKSGPSLIDQTRIGKDATMDDYPKMSFKERRKIVCRLDGDTKPLVCKNNPPVVTFNLCGQSLQYGSEVSKMTTYRHCPKCGDLHTFSLTHYNSGQGYMCANCVQKTWAPSLELQRKMFCVYCGRQHFKNVHQGLDLITTTDIGDEIEPVKLLNFCYADKPKYKHDFVFDKNNKENRFLILCLDTYMNRHDNMVYASSRAYFPRQNTVKENEMGIEMEQNGFTLYDYGKRYDKIPQLIDVWWTPLNVEATL